MTDFEELKQAVIDICHERDACRKGYRELLDCENTPQLVECFCRYWGDIMGNRFNEKAIAFMEKYYQPNRELWRRCGLAYQEGNSHGLCWIINTTEQIDVSGNAKAYIVGACKNVFMHDRSEAIMRDSDGSSITMYDYSACTCESNADILARDNALVNINNGVCYSNGHCTIYAGGAATVVATNWGKITANGFAVVRSMVKTRVFINEKASWEQTNTI